ERAKISAIIRVITSTVTSGPGISVRLSRLSKTAAGLVLECDSLGIAVHLGNIDQVIDTALTRSRSYFQKLVDAQDAETGKDDEAGHGAAALAAPQAAPATVDTVGKLDVSPIAPADPGQTTPSGKHAGEKSKAVSLTVISS